MSREHRDHDAAPTAPPRATGAGPWRLVLVASGVVVTALHALVAVSLWDIEAAAVASVGAVALALIRWRRGRTAGLILLASVLLDSVVWNAAGAIAHLRTAAATVFTVLTVVLAVTSALGVVAAVAAVIVRREPQRGGSAAAWTVGGAAASIAAGVAASLVGLGTPQQPQPGDVLVEAEATAFSATTLTAPTGTVTVHLTNHDFFWHTFSIPELDVRLAVPVGGEGRIGFDAVPGTYEFVCQIPGHAGAGMRGTLTVTP